MAQALKAVLESANQFYLALCLLTLVLGGLVIVIIYVLSEAKEEVGRDDEGDHPFEIPAYPQPPVLVTRWGIHRDHISRGFQTEAGCPVCYEFKLHIEGEER